MKSFKLLLLLVFVFLSGKVWSQNKTYDTEWKKVDELIGKKGLPKSALAEVKKIYALAKKDKNDPQVIKSLVYMTGLQRDTREDNEVESIKEIEKEISTAKEPARSILKSLLANLYWQYFQNNRYELYERSNTTNFSKTDIATWTITDFHKKISGLFLQSIENKSVLKQTRLGPFDAIIIKGNTRNLRPTLYDLLAHEALNYFKNDEHDIQKPAYAFEINQPEAFAPGAQFVKFTFNTMDSLSLQHKALLIYQELTAFHLNDAKPDALIDIETGRVQFVYENATMEEKDELYKSALENIINRYPSNPVAAQASFLLADYYNTLAAKYKPHGDTTHRFDRVTAKEILERVIKDSAVKSEGWTNSYNLLKQITDRSFTVTVEKVNVPEQPFRALINYTNVTNLNLRLIKPTEALKSRSYSDDQKFWDALIKATPIRTWKQTLPATNDHQQHSVEIKIDGLPIGEYVLLASYEDKFEKKDNPLRHGLFYVSNISHINEGDEFFILHRETGLPLNGASVQLWEQRYDNKTHTYIKTKAEHYKADANGYFKLAGKKNQYSYNFFFEITHNNDHLFLNELLYDRFQNDGAATDNISAEEFEKRNTNTYLFTDRSIYRPGQTLHFKGISLTKTKESTNKIRAGFQTKIYLRDANYQAVDSLDVETNQYGSFSGKFQLPANTLNGVFTLYMKENKGAQTIRVEEYKRPKFYVEFDKIKETYKVNDTVSLTGSAKAYAGNNIDGAKVSYRVVRRARFIYDWLRWWPQQTEEMEITNGELKTDAAGKFEIRFAAIPDRSISKETEPVFDYRIYVDVTDINGETRSQEHLISAGYKSLLLKVDLAERVPIDSFKTILIRTENMNSEYQPSNVSVTVFKLIPEQRLIRKRLWERPDQFVMNKQEFISHFPHDEYANETDFKTWQREGQVYSRSDSTKVSGEWSVVNGQLPEGFYVVEITTKDKEGQEIKDIQHVELFDEKSNRLSKPEYLWTKSSETIEPGEKTDIRVGSSANVFLVKRKDQLSAKPVVTYSFDKLSNEKKTYDFAATEADRGGYGMNFFFVRDNRFYSFNDIITIPWSNKELKIEYATFRDKTLPGSEEKWKVKISGNKNEKLAAEMLASMYDASLDQFYFHQWWKPGVWMNYSGSVYWNAGNFSTVQSNQRWIYGLEEEYYYSEYDRFGFEMYDLFNEGRNVRTMNQAGVKDEVVSVPPPVGQFTLANAVRYDRFSEMKVGDTTSKGSPLDTQTENRNQKSDPLIQPRKNFNETAFFFPDLKTDENGTIEFSFVAPEALTRWKLQTLAHTKELAFGLSQKELVTQKQLMVQPNMPRFLRQGDHLEITTKIVNLSDKELTGQAQLELFDATTNQSVDGWFVNSFPNQYFTVAAGQSEVVKFPVQVPMQFSNALVWRITARAPLSTRGEGKGEVSDAEENALPVLSNKILVTESLALPMRGSGTKDFTFEKLLNSGNSETLQHQSLTVEYTSNPAWYAVQALPYLMEFPYECSEQVWNRYYANALASKIANSSPRIKEIFDQWKTLDTAALLSNLQKNQELKTALLEETPWVLEAKTEEQQKKNIALLFDIVKMTNELRGNLSKLKELMNDNGSFPWFKGGYDDRYITQYILTGIGHLKKLNAITKEQEDDISTIINDGLNYLDRKIKEDYDRLLKNKANLTRDQIGDIHIQYLYMRSFFPERRVLQASQTAYNFYRKQAQQFWRTKSKYLQGMTALALNRTNDKTTPSAIITSLKETSITHEELGMYWKDNRFGYNWHWSHAPIETQSLMIEAFSEISKDIKSVDDLRTWLIKNKQTNNWSTTKATADACYAMLLQGTDWLNSEPSVQIKLGTTVITNTDSKTEAGTGYFKQTISGEKIQPAMGNISVNIQPPTPNSKLQTANSSWGAVYWQYFEDMDKITPASTPLQLNKKLFIEKNTDRGPLLTPVEEGSELHVGDKIKVRIELRVDRDMEYVHMKDMRASALEPVNVLSGYKWQGGLGYYESTKDASTNFFFDHLTKGTYVFEYPLFVTHTGAFSNGITTIQCMYAPEFSAHSEGVRIVVE